ncbi:complement C5 [Latimeria chalumnae]|uniref:Complement C5 n=1 Tax=Latimeria chalumnae TaxID=7897 RepID=H3AWN3_LATCH|nr:PREDICTED: complement C5 [Latimeria chalumnae]|eukprot:XP_014346298.1 PREDICTED: complement C5 [Latimeria chalumnae]
MMKFFYIFFVLALCERSICQEQTYLLTAPRVFRVGATETVVVQTFGYDDGFSVNIAIKSFPDKKTTFASESLSLSNANNFQGSVTLTIQPKDLPRKDSSKVYVYLEASSPGFTKEEKVLVSYQNGFLFIQLDKPIYTPDQSVKVRVYSLNEDLKPARKPITLTFVDPEGVKVDIIEGDDFTGVVSVPHFKIPSNPRYGIWKTEAAYKSDYTTSAIAEFEVKEYAMPSFSLSIEPERNFISYDRFENFNIAIKASYFYGKKVSRADVYVRFGIIDEQQEKTMLSGVIVAQLTEGVAEIFLDSKTEFARLGRESLEDLDGSYLYITVSVQEYSGGHTEEAELAEVKYVMSPYSINLVATPSYVKPGLPFHIQVQVKDTLGQPVGNIPVTLTAVAFDENHEEISLVDENSEQGKRDTLRANGVALFVVNIPMTVNTLQFKVKTADTTLTEESQISREYEARVYSSLTNSYLYIHITGSPTGLRVGNYFNVNLLASSPYKSKIKQFGYQVMSKGKLVIFGTIDFSEGVVVHNLNIEVTSEMVPSARLIVYYVVTGEGSAELVVDSVWINVEEKCTSKKQVVLSKDAEVYKPGKDMFLSIEAEPSSFVALSSVDSAIYGVRTKAKKSIERMLQHIEKSDLGCGAGGGKNNADVFRLAGLTFMTNANAKALEEHDEPCTVIMRPKRSVNFEKQVEQELSRFKNPTYKKCCLDGIKAYPITETCDQRARRIRKGEQCFKAFRYCCQFANKLRFQSHTHTTLGRMNIVASLEVEETQVRSYFPESWLWEVHEVTARSGSKRLAVTLPDSLTTWQIQGIGISDNGICVADPLKVQVFKEVFLKMQMPYSVIRGEQIELRGSIYNYKEVPNTALVSMTVGDGICLFKGSATGSKGTQSPPIKMVVRGSSVSSVSYVILPLELGLHTINFTLKSQYGNEIVMHTLRVVPEGIKKEQNVGVTLDPQGIYGFIKRRHEFRYMTPKNVVPKSDINRTVSVKGEIMGEIIATVLSAEGLNLLNNLPRGSGEAELMSIVPVYYVFYYLEKSDNWKILGSKTLTIRMNMRRKMIEGVTSILSFKVKGGHAYSMWKDGVPSTWLTAFVVRIFGELNEYVPLDEMSVCNSVMWLIEDCQKSNGLFKETSNYQAVKLQGTIPKESEEREIYLTAFTVIGIQKAFHMCPTRGIQDAIFKAIDILSNKWKNVQSTYTLAITAYALAVQNRRTLAARFAFASLKKEALVKGNPPVYRFWKETSSQVDTSTPSVVTARIVETTAYALLVTILNGDMNYAKPIIKWLSEQQRYGGGFYSTQDTIIALQSLTEYAVLLKRSELDMIIKVSNKKHGEFLHFEMTEEKSLVRAEEVPKDDDLVISTGSGTGISTVHIKTVYHAVSTSEENCDFSLRIQGTPNIDPLSAGTRKRRESEPLQRIEACAKYLPRKNEEFTESSHAVMDIGLVTGLAAEEEDLDTLANGVDNLISDYKIADGHVILQLDQIPSDDYICVAFRVREMFNVGMLSPAVFTVYEYHTPDRRCSIFYNPYGNEKLVKLCQGNECKCMEVECSQMQKEINLTVSANDRIEAACKEDIVYAYKVNILSAKEDGNFVKYSASILDIYKKGADRVKQTMVVTFIKKKTCTDVLKIGKHYLIMGTEGIETKNYMTLEYDYPLDSKVWIELWPSEQDCDVDTCTDFIKTLEEFSENVLFFGCS